MRPPAHEIRIIGGRFKGRHLKVPSRPGLRPTPDRIRETVFNWLGPKLAGADCLDLFAGTGALSFEALSRGAASVTLVEKDRSVCQVLDTASALCDPQSVHIINRDALDFLSGNAQGFDVIFLDPPYADGLLTPALEALRDGIHLREGAVIYVEMSSAERFLVPGFRCLREASAGQVRYALWEKSPFGI